MKKTSWILFLISAILLIFVTCKKDKDDNQTTELVTGIVTGKVFAQNGSTPIPMASVFIDVNGEIYFTYTNKDGEFNLEAPAGTHDLYVESGRGNIFRAVYSVTIPEKGTYTAPNGTLKLLQTANLAYIKGAWDNIQTIVIDSLGYTATELTVSDLDNPATLANYSGLFLNCGKYGVLDSAKYENLLNYVNNGGSIYASDYAVEYLTGDNNYKFHNTHNGGGIPAKTCVGESGGFIDDSLLCTDKIGPYIVLHDVDILPTDVQDYMGITQIDINYDLNLWEQIMDVDTPPWEVLIEDATYGPLALRWTFNSIINKSFHQNLDQGWITICHFPPGNPSNFHTITISINALPAHLAHGDYIGSCQGNGGTIYFTTFHNHVQGTYNSDMQKMLEYFILNL